MDDSERSNVHHFNQAQGSPFTFVLHYFFDKRK